MLKVIKIHHKDIFLFTGESFEEVDAPHPRNAGRLFL